MSTIAVSGGAHTRSDYVNGFTLLLCRRVESELTVCNSSGRPRALSAERTNLQRCEARACCTQRCSCRRSRADLDHDPWSAFDAHRPGFCMITGQHGAQLHVPLVNERLDGSHIQTRC